MELEELKPAWERLTARVQTLEQALDVARQQHQLDKARSALRWQVTGHLMVAGGWLYFVMVVARFWVEHRDQASLLLSGIVLHVYGVLGLLASVLQLLLIAHVRYAGSVVELQRRLGSLAQLQALLSFALGIPWLWLWVPLTLVASTLLAGVNLYAVSAAWVWSSLAFGTAAMLVSVVLARYWIRRPPRSLRLRRAADLLSGRAFSRLRAEVAAARCADRAAV